MRRVLILTLVLCPLTACGSSAAASGASSSRSATPAFARCGPADARTLGASSLARVYVQSTAVYGCGAGSTHSYLLGHASVCINSDRVGPVAVAGRMAAYAVTRCGVDTGSANVEVRRLSDGTRLFSQPAALASGPEGYVSVTDIVATPAGAVAWIARASSIVSHRSSTGVFAGRTGRLRQLGSGAIALRSLRLTGSSLSWQDGSIRRSAHLS